MAEKSKTKRKAPIPMTEEERAFVRKTYENKEYTVKEIADAINKSESAVHRYASSVGLSRRRTKQPEPTKPGHKICNGCGEELPFEAYTKNKNRKYGVEARCKACEKLAEIKRKEKKLIQSIIEKTPVKACTICKEEKELNTDNFSWYANRQVFASECKACANKRSKEAIIKNYREKGYKK